jgi:hypothetical protein
MNQHLLISLRKKHRAVPWLMNHAAVLTVTRRQFRESLPARLIESPIWPTRCGDMGTLRFSGEDAMISSKRRHA